MKINFFDLLGKYSMNIERGNMWNQFLVSSVLVSSYAVTKVLSPIWGAPFYEGPSSCFARTYMKIVRTIV